MKTVPDLKTKLSRILGFDIRREKYAYDRDPRFGHMSETRIADKWVSTTCGYCSVGCGMLVGIREGKAVAVRGNPDHPVNPGKLCPKGLSEHHILDAPGRAKQPLLRKQGELGSGLWDEALDTMIEKFTEVQARYGRSMRLVLSAPASWLRKSFTPSGKLVQLGFRQPQPRRQHHAVHGVAVSGYKLSFGSDGPPGSYTDMERRM